MQRALKTCPDKRDLRRKSAPRHPAQRAAQLCRAEARRSAACITISACELDGVLKSWAVSHGPSLDPAQKRLAVRTADYPLKTDFLRGSIPRPTAGPAAETLWDIGHWSPRGDPREGLRNGLLKFDLHGERLKGGFALLRLAKAAREKRENWLLVKEGDAYAERSKDGAQQIRIWPLHGAQQRFHADKAVGSRGEPARATATFRCPRSSQPSSPRRPRATTGCTRSSTTAIARSPLSAAAACASTRARARTGPTSSPASRARWRSCA